jgi:hypothetical protein
VGEHRMAVFDDVHQEDKLQLYDKKIDLVNGQFVVNRPTPQTFFHARRTASFGVPALYRMRGDRQTPKTDGHDAWRVLKVMEASQRSLSMNGEPVTGCGALWIRSCLRDDEAGKSSIGNVRNRPIRSSI